MFGILLKSGLAFCASYIILSFQVNNTYLFEHINKVTGPVGEKIQLALSESFAQAWGKAKEASGQLFTNSEPQATVEDEVAKTQSALERHFKPGAAKVAKPVETYLDDLRKEEKESLSRIIEND